MTKNMVSLMTAHTMYVSTITRHVDNNLSEGFSTLSFEFEFRRYALLGRFYP